jgi:hypothetical protein
LKLDRPHLRRTARQQNRSFSFMPICSQV